MGYATKESIKRLVKELNLQKGDGFTQDWEYEMADSKKIGDFLLIE